MSAPRVETANTHGTGDTFSACIAAELAKGKDLKEAIIIGKKFIQAAISQPISLGMVTGQRIIGQRFLMTF